MRLVAVVQARSKGAKQSVEGERRAGASVRLAEAYRRLLLCLLVTCLQGYDKLLQTLGSNIAEFLQVRLGTCRQ